MTQKTLPGVPRVRTPIKDDATTEDVVLRLPRRVATAVMGNVEGAVNALQADLEGFMGVTKWLSGKPPGEGWWEVTDHKTGTMLQRWWFGGVWWVMGGLGPEARGATGIHWEKFNETYSYRGLASPPIGLKYPCPPYDLRTLPRGCELDVILAARPRTAINVS